MTVPIGVGPSRHLNLIGSISGNLGLGVAARALGMAALARGFRVTVLDLDPGHGRGGVEIAPAFVSAEGPNHLPSGINLFVLPPLSVVDLLGRSDVLSKLLGRDDCFNAVFTFWELPVLPQLWARALELFDAVVAPSGYIEGAMDFALSGTPVVRGLTPLELPSDIRADRGRFAIPGGSFVAVTSFDPLSDPERKNPQAAIEAFRRAFGAGDKARLVVKLNAPANGYADEALNRTVLRPLLQDLQADPRTLVITERLSYRDVLSLYASADAFISLHRAEGLGLGLLESMALGKPVIATGWSGNKAFMSPSNACSVRHSLVPTKGRHKAYLATMSGKPVWAEPDIDDAALWLRRLARDPVLCHSIGAAARQAFLRYQSEAAALGFLGDLVALHDHQRANPMAPSSEARGKRVREVQRKLLRADMSALQRVGAHAWDQFERRIGWRLTARLAPK